MAINKRFLGLGFSFAATDKGLEKKLKGVRSELLGIRSALSDINGSSRSASRGLKSMKTGGTSRAKQQSRAKPAAAAPAAAKKSSRVMLGDIGAGSAIAKNNIDFFNQLKESLNGVPDHIRAVAGQMQNFSLTIDETGKITKESQSAFLKTAQQVIQSVPATNSLGKSLALVKERALMLTQYLKNVGASFSNFAQSLGIDFSKMIPPQFSAAFNLFKTAVLNPILSGAKGIASKVMGSGKKALAAKSLKRLEKINDDISGTRADSVVSLLGGINENTNQKKEGFFDKIKGMLTGFSPGKMIATLLGGAGLKQLLGKGGILRSIGSMAAGALKKPGALRFIGRLAGELAVLYVLFKQFSAYMGGWLDGFSKFMPAITQNLSIIGSNLWTAFKDWIVRPLMDIGSSLWKAFTDWVIDPIKNGLGAIWDMVPDAFKNFAKDMYTRMEPVIIQITDGVVNFLGFIVDTVRDTVKALLNPSKLWNLMVSGLSMIGNAVGGAQGAALEAITAKVAAATSAIPKRDFTPTSAGTTTAAAMERQTAVLEDIHKTLEKQKQTPITVQTTIKSKGPSLEKYEQEQYKARGP